MCRISCVGTLIIDIINKKVAQLPIPGECVTTDVSLNLGGNAYSSSVNIRRLTPPKTSVYSYGLIGVDDIGLLFEKGFQKEGVISCLTKVDGTKTSCNIILQELDKERRYIFNEGANAFATKGDLLKIIDNVKPDVVIFGELPSLNLTGTDFVEIVKYVKLRYKSLVVLDLIVNANEDYNWLSGYWDTIDVLHGNTWEGQNVTKKTAQIEMCQWFLDQGVTLPIISDGEKGCCFGYKKTVNHIPAFKTEEIDATGAGDALLAGIIKGLFALQIDNQIPINNIPPHVLHEIISYGSACGAIAVGTLGCIGDISVDTVEKFMRNQ